MIHQTAIIAPGAELDSSVTVGPYAVIGEHVKIGAGTTVGPHTVIEGHTEVGCDNQILATVIVFVSLLLCISEPKMVAG